jgi:hypothetical protein
MAKAMTALQRRILKSISSSQARQFVASYANGKQKRTKTRKEKTEEAKNLVAATLSNPRQASSVKLPTKRASCCLPDYPALASATNRVLHPSRFTKGGVLALYRETLSPALVPEANALD